MSHLHGLQDGNFHDLNVSRNIELLTHFKENNAEHKSNIIHGEQVLFCRYMHISRKSVLILTFDANCQSILEQEQEVEFFLCLKILKQLLSVFFIKSLPTFSFICWLIWLSMKDKIECHYHFSPAKRIISSFKDISVMFPNQPQTPGKPAYIGPSVGQNVFTAGVLITMHWAAACWCWNTTAGPSIHSFPYTFEFYQYGSGRLWRELSFSQVYFRESKLDLQIKFSEYWI